MHRGVPANVPIAGGCSLLVTPLFGPVLPVPLGGARPGSGTFVVTGPMPLAAAGFTFGLQVLSVDPGAPVGFSASNALIVSTP
ncbi:MAG: hypothetical protein H6834_18695 [Planctomycetes bacterium]|nr:hypothetical protein [Planctomycetota bacterium]